MKYVTLVLFLFTLCFGHTQSLPIDFESTVTVSDFVDFDGGTASIVDNPLTTGENPSAKVAQIVREGGTIWSGSKILLDANLDFSSSSSISMKVFTTAPVGTIVKFKLEGVGTTERDVATTVSGEWETLTWDFTGAPADFNWIVFMFDFGNVGDGSVNSTFLFDDVEQIFTGAQIDLPVNFEESGVNYSLTDFGGNVSSLVDDPTDAGNTVAQVIKTDEAATWAGTTIGTNAGFATNIPLTLTESIMSVRVWSPEAGTPIRLKVEDSNDPTHTCETETNTSVAGWEILEFNFVNQAPGTESLSVGLSMGWTYNMASIFFNFNTEGSAAGETTYYFDEVVFGELIINNKDLRLDYLNVYPNPATNHWKLVSDKSIEKVELYKLSGQMISCINPMSNSAEINAENLLPGIYFARINGDFKTEVVQLIKL